MSKAERLIFLVKCFSRKLETRIHLSLFEASILDFRSCHHKSSFSTKVFRISAIPYEVTVYTGDCSGAGTDANVFLQLYGFDGTKTEQHNLRSRSDNFERGYVDKFKVRSQKYGSQATR